LEQLRADGLSIVEFDGDPIGPDNSSAALAARSKTLPAMQSGADVVFQAFVGDENLSGRTGFLRPFCAA